MGDKIRLLIVDDHLLVRDGAKVAIAHEPDIVLVGEGRCGEDFERLATQLRPDVVLLDLTMPQRLDKPRDAQNIFQPMLAILWCAQHYPSIRILILAQQVDFSVLDTSARTCIVGYLLKDDINAHTLPAAIRLVTEGYIYFSPLVNTALRNRTGLFPALTTRQIHVLRQVLAQPDKAYAYHAAALGIKEGTLKKHLHIIFKRLGVRSLAAAALLAVRAGWIDLS